VNPEKRDRTIFVGAVIVLVYTFIQACMPVDEVPSQSLNFLSIVLELAMFVGVVGMAPRILRSVPEGASRGGWIFLAVVGVIAGIGIFGIRLSGGPRVELSPRPTVTTSATPTPGMTDAELKGMHDLFVSIENARKKPSNAPSPPGDNFNELALQTNMLPAVADYVTALKRLQATRWIKSPDANSYHPQKITRGDLHDAGEKLRELIATIDKLRKDLDAQTLPVPAAEKEFWRIKRETSIAFQKLTKLLEENWNEWRVSGIEPKAGEAKPWQKEALRLQGEVDKLKQTEQTSILL
jgi:hypothetical protein